MITYHFEMSFVGLNTFKYKFTLDRRLARPVRMVAKRLIKKSFSGLFIQSIHSFKDQRVKEFENVYPCVPILGRTQINQGLSCLLPFKIILIHFTQLVHHSFTHSPICLPSTVCFLLIFCILLKV